MELGAFSVFKCEREKSLQAIKPIACSMEFGRNIIFHLKCFSSENTARLLCYGSEIVIFWANNIFVQKSTKEIVHNSYRPKKNVSCVHAVRLLLFLFVCVSLYIQTWHNYWALDIQSRSAYYIIRLYFHFVSPPTFHIVCCICFRLFIAAKCPFKH